MYDEERDLLESALALRDLWRRRGEPCVAASGCFDGENGLHFGHLHLLAEAGRLGRLVVAVNSDSYCRRVKGPGRPLRSSEIRRQRIAAGSTAALVLPLNDDTPRDLWAALQPDYLVLGSDHRRKDPAGRDLPGAEHCGNVIFVERLPGFSTTELVVSGGSDASLASERAAQRCCVTSSNFSQLSCAPVNCAFDGSTFH